MYPPSMKSGRSSMRPITAAEERIEKFKQKRMKDI
jgi:hypothetical protein